MITKKFLLETIDSNLKVKKPVNEFMVGISSVESSYPNIIFHNRTKGDQLNKALLDDLQKAAKANDFKITVDYAKTGHGKFAKSGKVSRHHTNSAVDIDFIYSDGKKYVVSPKNRDIVEKFTDTLVNLGYNKNAEGKSNPKSVLTFGLADHSNHVHVSNTSDTASDKDIEVASSTTKSGSDDENEKIKDIASKLDKEEKFDFETFIQNLKPGQLGDLITKGFTSIFTEEVKRIKELMK